MVALNGLAAAAALVAVLGAGALGWRQGAARVQGRWDAADLQRERDAREDADEMRRIANRAGLAYEGQRVRIASVLPAARAAVGAGLRIPLQCAPGASQALGDVRVPASVVDGLRAAGAGGPAP